MITMYATRSCPYCHAARQLLESKGCAWEEIDVAAHADRRREMMERSGQHTVPQIWIGERHVGGYDDLAALNRSGKLDELLSQQGESGR